MDNSIVILFYSKYCPLSLKLIEDMEQYMNFKKICVDNRDIRNTILNESERYNITEVPCIFVFFSSGLIHKYEGQKAIDWSQEILLSFQKTNQIMPPETSQVLKSSFKELQSIDDIQSNSKLNLLPISNSENLSDQTVDFKSFSNVNTDFNNINSNDNIISLDSKNKYSNINNNINDNINDINNDNINHINDNNYNDNHNDMYQEENLMGMKRRMETSPLIQPPSQRPDIELANHRMDSQRNDKKMTDKKNESIINMAQSLQAQRERDDESIHPSAISKIMH